MKDQEKFIIWCDQAMAFCFYALIYFLPISIALAEIFTGLALGCYILKRGISFNYDLKIGTIKWSRLTLWHKIQSTFKAFKPIKNCLNLPIAALLMISAVSIPTSEFPMESIKGFFGKILQSAFIYFNFIECINSKKRLKIFLTVFYISCLLICINGIYQYFAGQGFIRGYLTYDGRISSSLRQANDLGAYLLIVIPALFYVCLCNSLKFRVVIFVLFSLATICLGLTYSRGAWIGFISSFIILGIRDIKVLFLSLGMIILFIIFFYLNIIISRGEFVDWNTLLLQNNRIVYWKDALDIAKDYLIFGSGLNTYSRVSTSYQLNWGGYPHNCYLQMLVETGIIGLLSFIMLFIVLFGHSFKVSRKINDQHLKLLLFGFLTGLLGFLIHGFFDTIFYSVQLCSLMWIVMGVIAVIPIISRKTDDYINTNQDGFLS